MLSKNSILAIIPARAGSKGIENKNLVSLNNKPLISYTIDAAIYSNKFDKICVSTNSLDISKIAEKYPIDVIIRPEIISGDFSKTIDAVIHVLDYYNSIGEKYEIVVLLQPTSPLRSHKHISEALNIFINNSNIICVASFCESKHHPYKQFYIDKNFKISPLFGSTYLAMARQSLPAIIRQNGAIYINFTSQLLKYKEFIIDPVFPYMMNEIESLDIDNETDLEIANYFMSKYY